MDPLLGDVGFLRCVNESPGEAMIGLEEWVDIMALHRQGVPIKEIARQVGVSRNTVKRALRREGPPARTPQRRPPSKLEPFKDYLVSRLAEFPQLSAEALFEEVRAQGYEGQISILKDFTRPYRIRRREPVVRFETPPGKQAQVDWGELGTHELPEPTRLHLFCLVLGFSRALYAEVTTRADLATFLSCHEHAFHALGGMPEEILYDNLKLVVLSRRGGQAHFHPEFLAFSGHYGFRPRLCRPYRAKTKGKVERMIGYLKDRFFCGRTFTDVADMNDQLERWLAEVANVREHQTTKERPADRLLREGLLPVAAARPWPKLIQPPTPRAGQVLFRIAPPAVEERLLSVYEEVLG
jgi:transposase